MEVFLWKGQGQKELASVALSFQCIQAAASQLCLRLSNFSDPWEACLWPPSPDLILTPVFCPQVYTSSQPLRVGYYETDNYTMPTPAMKRALLETKKSLEATGHTVRLRKPRSPGTATPSGRKALLVSAAATSPWHAATLMLCSWSLWEQYIGG